MKNVIRLPLVRISELLEKRDISSLELVCAYLDKIDTLNGRIGAYLTVCGEEAKRNAIESDLRRSRKESLGALDGVPFAAKDNICTLGVRTTCASRMLENYIPPYDATVIRKLKDAGAVLLGKTNMDEFAMGSLNRDSAFGITRNPLDEKRYPGGSSGGSAAAVCADMAAFALGSDTGGSVRLPASYCGLCALKPTYGAVSRYGLAAYASSYDVIGPICKNADDASVVFHTIRGRDERDATSVDIKAPEIPDLSDIRVAIPAEYFEAKMDAKVREAVLECIDRLGELGVQVSGVSVPSYSVSLAAYYIICMAEASSNLARYDGIRYGMRSGASFENIEEFVCANRSEGFGDEVKRRILVGTYVLSDGYIDKYYKKAQAVRRRICAEADAVFAGHDIIMLPVSPYGPPLISEDFGESVTEGYVRDAFNVFANLTGCPSVAVVCGYDGDGMPVGVQLVGRAGSEELLLCVARSIEKITAGRPEVRDDDV